MAAIMFGNPVVVKDNRTAWLISSGAAPDASAFLVDDITAPLEFAPMAIPSLMRSWHFSSKGPSSRQ